MGERKKRKSRKRDKSRSARAREGERERERLCAKRAEREQTSSVAPSRANVLVLFSLVFFSFVLFCLVLFRLVLHREQKSWLKLRAHVGHEVHMCGI